MDIPRGKEVARRRLIRRIALGVVAVAIIGGTTIALARLKPAAPAVDMSGLWPGTVKRGPLEIQVHGLGALKPEEIHDIAAAQDCRVAEILRLPGLEILKPNDVIMVLSDPDLELEAEKAEWQLKQDEANQANQLEKRVALEKQRLKIADDAARAQIQAQEVVVESDRAAYELKKRQVDQLTIRAGIEGQLQEVDVEVGQRVAAGTVLAKVANPHKLKAVLQIAETQMKDVAI